MRVIAAGFTIWVSFLIGSGCQHTELLSVDGRPGDRVTPPLAYDTDGDETVTDMSAFDGIIVDDSDMGAGGDTSADPFIKILPVDAPRNVVLLIGDGMGRNHIDATSLYAYGEVGSVYFQDFEVSGLVTTHSANTDVTDSAAASTAMATGHKVNNNTVSLAVPGDGAPLPTLLEYFQGLGKATGLVTTATVTHATPAGFGAHTTHRNNTDEIAEEYLTLTRPNVLFGGGGSGMTPEAAVAAGYTVLENLLGFDSEALPDTETHFISGQFGLGYMGYEYDGYTENRPHLWEMGAAAVSVLLDDPDGFFVMIEGARIDHACHDNRFERMVFELLAFERTVAELTTDDRLEDTLFIVTSDHGTGGLIIDVDNGQGEMPDVHWISGIHTGEDVPLYAMGPGSEAFAAAFYLTDGLIDNTDIHRILTELIAW